MNDQALRFDPRYFAACAIAERIQRELNILEKRMRRRGGDLSGWGCQGLDPETVKRLALARINGGRRGRKPGSARAVSNELEVLERALELAIERRDSVAAELARSESYIPGVHEVGPGAMIMKKITRMGVL